MPKRKDEHVSAAPPARRRKKVFDVLLAADNLNALNPVVGAAMESLDPEPIRKLARRCESLGCDFLDINPGRLSKRKEDRMEFLVQTVQESTSLSLILDSPEPRVLARGLSVCRETPILNALSLEDHKLDGTLPLAVEHETPLVALLMDERSFTPPSMEEKLAIALEIVERAVNAGMTLDRMIVDPVTPNMSWPDARFRTAEAIKTVRYLSTGAIFQEPVQTMAGLSNLRSGLRDRHPFALEERCLGLFAGAGLAYVLADALQSGFRMAYEHVSSMA